MLTFLLPLLGGGLMVLAAWSDPLPLHAQSAHQTLRGSRVSVLGPVPLHAGLLVLHARSNGTENFAVDLVTQDPDSTVPVTRDPTAFGDFYDMINTTGRYDGARAVLLKSADSYYASVTITSGPFELTFEQPTVDAVSPVHQTDFSGKGQQVTPYFTLSAGVYTITARSKNSALRVWLYELGDDGGRAIGSDETGYDDELIDTTINPEYTSPTVTLPNDGTYVLSMNPDGAGPRDWSVSIR
jgi:hypothetical protein